MKLPTPRRQHQKRNKLLSQQSMYNGLKFQILVTPYGLISHLFDPYPETTTSKCFEIATLIRSDPRFRSYRICGDCAFGRDDVMASPFEGAFGNLTRDHRQINSAMSKIQVSVVW
ncbi:LOW QUALITY PROTEIN: hypothetical protein PHPALM_30577 [Phytophthora palmivora]|uniref:DDE Tnp4 domain-containing protein n=1 Tax=Phytophthora palmivora TaxID=4796 RepID=A0A2P4X4T2_9STRA|nr:LOW QUALITY PROTEIN: hypothetical protein PHPALM_30577 [Phytophthora palmivora]